MNRFFAGSMFLAAVLLSLTAGYLHADDRKPNVVILYVDDLGWKDIGCYGGPVKTPVLDDMAAKGIRFTDFHSPAAVCSPSRASLLTGRHRIRSGVYSVIRRWHRVHLLEREVTIAEMLKENGYATAHIGKWHIGSFREDHHKSTPDQHGFDYWYGAENGASPSHKDPINFVRNGKPVGKLKGYACQLYTDEAISWMKARKEQDKPFFLNIWFHEPHSVIAAPDEIVSKYGKLNDRAAIYSGTIENTDRAIGRLLDELKKKGILENTFIVYASDNGSYRKDRVGPLREKKGSMFEGGHRVPGIVYWPGTIKPGVVDEPAGMIDMLPTIARVTGTKPPKGVHLDGADISPLLLGKAKKFKRDQMMFWCSEGMAMVRDGKYALVGYAKVDIKKDKERLSELFKIIEKLMQDTNDPLLVDGKLPSINFSGHPKSRKAGEFLMEYHKIDRFNESWIPALKKAKFRHFLLFDLEKDISQKKDVSKGHPEVFEKMKKELIRIHASVMADGPDWN